MNKTEERIADIGEFGLIERIQKFIPTAKHRNLILGIGDDAAVIKMNKNRVLLVTCDIQVEGQHFRWDYITPFQLGKRAMAVNLSDIAAMGGEPTFVLVSLALPESCPVHCIDDLYAGMQQECTAYQTHIVGGNMSRSDSHFVIDITLLGEAPAGKFLPRHSARVGDRIFVTGTPGKAAAGFAVLAKYGRAFPELYAAWVNAHLQPAARVRLGQQIARSGWATAMIDLSDGLANDLGHICTRSHVGAEIFQSQLPTITALPNLHTITHQTPTEMALHGGEDYELLFTVKPETAGEHIRKLAHESGVPITEIGQILPYETGLHLIDEMNRRFPIEPTGWDHFSHS